MKTRNTEYVDGYISPILTSEHYLLWIEWTIEGNKVSKSVKVSFVLTAITCLHEASS